MLSPARPVAALAVALSLLGSACGSESDTGSTAAPDAASVTTDAADVLDLEIVDVETGQPTTIADTVTGDRPVLLWFWAPH